MLLQMSGRNQHIMLNVRNGEVDKVLGLQVAKVDDYITKPFGPKELLESINRVFGKEKPDS